MQTSIPLYKAASIDLWPAQLVASHVAANSTFILVWFHQVGTGSCPLWCLLLSHFPRNIFTHLTIPICSTTRLGSKVSNTFGPSSTSNKYLAYLSSLLAHLREANSTAVQQLLSLGWRGSDMTPGWPCWRLLSPCTCHVSPSRNNRNCSAPRAWNPCHIHALIVARICSYWM